jgi:hypothetical protein
MTRDAMSSEPGDRRGHAVAVSMRVEAFDGHRRLLWPAVAGLVGAATLALIGLPPVDLHGPLHRLGVMDPLCGGTRAMRAAAEGHLVTAWRYNPLSVVLFGGALIVVARVALGAASGRWLNVRLAPRRLVVAVGIVVVGVLEVNQQLHASLLMRSAVRAAPCVSLQVVASVPGGGACSENV